MKKILAVEDDVTQRYVLKIVLESFAMNFKIVPSAEEALALLFEQKKRFAFILMDIKLLGMDGFECTREIRRRERAAGSRRITIIAVTAYASVDDRNLCFEAGMDDYLSKPYTLDSLRELIDKYLERAVCDEENCAESK
jgi:CheY-like chemotaxis protein